MLALEDSLPTVVANDLLYANAFNLQSTKASSEIMKVVICGITRFRNRVHGFNFMGPETRFQLLSK